MYIRSMIEIQTSVRIERPADAVFALLSDPREFPLWNSAVDSVRRTGTTYAMRRTLPTGPADNELEIVESEAPTRFAIRTLSGPTPFVYRYRLVPDDGATVVELDATVELGGPVGLLGPLAARAVKRGIDANLGSLRDALERDGGDRYGGGRVHG
jgi:carbon monoxide dehydrogenase subunit G